MEQRPNERFSFEGAQAEAVFSNSHNGGKLACEARYLNAPLRAVSCEIRHMQPYEMILRHTL